MPHSFAQIVIDFPGRGRQCFRRPRAVLRADRIPEVITVIAAAETAARQGCTVAGFVSYEAAPAFERVMRVRGGARLPLAWFAVFETTEQPDASRTNDFSLPCFSTLASIDDFTARVERIRHEIACGRTYQVNLTTRFTGQFKGDAFAFYESLRRAQGPAFHAFIDAGDFQIVSVSPELFFETRGRRIRTRPMKGTRARGRWDEEDRSQAAELAASEKDRAENLMIVDLLRNDLGRVAKVGSVGVTSLFELEQYRTVHQLTSTIEAELRDDVALTDVFAALFPCGSVTGAPKISTMELIAELEDSPREVYCGALGMIEPNGNATFNVPIRTVWIERETGHAVYGSGGGITFDSDPRAEYAEVQSKVAVLLEAWPEFELLETMRAEHGVIVRLERHLARVLASARYFDIPAREAAIRPVLESAAARVGEPRMIRLLIDQHGNARTEERSIELVTKPRTGLAGSPVSSNDRFLFHKTTNRHVYDARLAEMPECWDVLLTNECGEITEFTRGNVVVERQGALLTPPRACGLLAGTFRAELLETGIIREATLRVDDLRHASRIWLINSVREWVEVDLTT